MVVIVIHLEGLSSQAAAGSVPISTFEIEVAPPGETAPDEHVVDAHTALQTRAKAASLPMNGTVGSNG